MADQIVDIVGRSLYVSGLATMIACAVGIPVGVLLGRSSRRWARVARLVAHTLLGLPPVVVGLVLYLAFSRSGPLGSWGWLFTTRIMVLAQVLLATPFVVAVVATAVAAVPVELEFQLRAIGASRVQARCMALREALPGVALGAAAAFGRSISEVGAVLIVGGNIEWHTRVLTTAIVLETSRGNFKLALVLGSILLVLALVANAALLALSSGSTVRATAE